MKSRVRIIAACGFAILIFGLLFSFYGYEDTWKLWNIPIMSPHFADLRTITGGAESYAQGFDPMIVNLGDPWQRTLNYPRVWQSLYSIGVTQNHTTYIGIIFILLFLVGICLVLPDASHAMILLVMAAVLSPATLLGIERGNIDLLMFFLAALSSVLIKRWHVFSAVAVLLGFVLKLFPIFGCAVLLRVNRPTFFRYALAVFVFIALYIAFTYSDILLIEKGTPKSTSLSYGLNVLWMNLASLDPTVGKYVRFFSYLVVMASLWYAYTGLLREDSPPENQNPVVFLGAFRAGAAIYIGTFMLGNNYDYRLMFLIFTIPQLAMLRRCTVRHISVCSSVVLSAIFISLWYLMIVRFAYDFSYGGYVTFALDEISHWIVFAGLLFLLSWSMPDWIKSFVHKGAKRTNGLARETFPG